MIRRAAIVLAALVSTSLFAQIPNGSVIILRGPSGAQLSARPAEEIGWSPNQAAWEQWTYSSTQPLVSVWGTTLIREGNSIRHTAYFDGSSIAQGDAAFYVTGLTSSPNTTRLTSGALNSGGRAAISYRDGTSCLWDNGGQLSVGQCNLNSYDPATAWTVSVAPNPAPRSARRFAARNGLTTPRSKGGTYFIALGNLSSNEPSVPGVHGAKSAPVPLLRRSFSAGGDSYLRFGDSLWLYAISGLNGTRYQLNQNYDFKHAVENDSMRVLKLIDPTGWHKDGNRIPKDFEFCLSWGGGVNNISLDPGNRTPRMSPNCSDWERFTMEEQ